jgi:hypothetical protein
MICLPACRYNLEKDRLTIEIPNQYRAMVLVMAKSCSAGYMKVEIGKPGKPRTTGDGSQSHHINGHVQQIAAETGNSFDDVKVAAKYEAMARGYPFRTIAGQPIPLSESEIDTIAAGHLIETLHQIAAELGIILKE